MEEKIKVLLGEIKNDPSMVEKLSSSSSIVDDVGLDSLQMINFILRVEDDFGV